MTIVDGVNIESTPEKIDCFIHKKKEIPFVEQQNRRPLIKTKKRKRN